MAGVRAWWRGVDRRLMDAAVVVLLFASMAVSMATKPLLPGQHAPTWWAYLLCAGLCLPFAFHRRRPVVALAAQCVVLLAYAPGAWPAFPGLPVFALVAGVALHCDRRRALLAAAALAGALVVAVRLQPAGVQDSSTIVATLLAVAVSWLWGANLRGRRARIAALEDRARLAEAEREDRARLAVAEERVRIARELHDVVAHAMSVIVGAGRRGAPRHRHAPGGGARRRCAPSRRRAATRWSRCAGCSACCAARRRPGGRAPAPAARARRARRRSSGTCGRRR